MHGFYRVGVVKPLNGRRLPGVDRPVVAGFCENAEERVKSHRQRRPDERNPLNRHEQRKDRSRKEVVRRIAVLALEFRFAKPVVIGVQEDGAQRPIEQGYQVQWISGDFEQWGRTDERRRR